MTSLVTAAACSVVYGTTHLGEKLAGVESPSAIERNEVSPRTSIEEPAAHAPDGAAAAAAITQVTMIPRAGWSAAEPSVSTDGYGERGPFDSVSNPSGWLIYDQPLETVINKVIIHHSALPLSDGPREIQRLHTEEKGFADIGYHFLIDDKGQLFEGRSLQVRGAHTYGANYGSLGVCLLGNFEEIQPFPAQMTVLKNLLSSLITRYPGIIRLSSHRDHNPGVTLCPGANLFPLLPALARELNLTYGA